MGWIFESRDGKTFIHLHTTQTKRRRMVKVDSYDMPYDQWQRTPIVERNAIKPAATTLLNVEDVLNMVKILLREHDTLQRG
jgi:hypothetical protein